jgi:hypothetical protein
MPDLTAPRLAGSACGACEQAAVVQWLRRPSDTELGTLRVGLPRGEAQAVTVGGTTIAVHACPLHAITAALAARIHAATCAAPTTDKSCTCTPELPVLDPFESPARPELPAGW